MSLPLSLPLSTAGLSATCRVLCCAVVWCGASLSSSFSLSLPQLARLWSWRAFAVYCGWLLLHFVLYLVVPGGSVHGVTLDKHGNRLLYPTNGQLQQHG